jgi:ABC-2 type transport system permease protein
VRAAPAGPDEGEVVVRTSEPPRLHLWRRLRELLGYREILRNLIRRELKVKYTSSLLGAAWSMLNPLLYLAVFTLVFELVLDNGVPDFAVYLLSGLLAWNFFSSSLGQASRSVVDNGNLVKKVYFPREILPLASMGAALVDFGLQALILIGFLAVFTFSQPYGANLWLLPLSLVALLAFTASLSLWVSALNVRYRDTQHLLTLALLAWFWLTPVVYASGFLQNELSSRSVAGLSVFSVYLVNPMGSIIFGFQRALYGNVHGLNTATGERVQVLVDQSVAWHAASLGIVIVGSILLLYVFWRVFFRLSGDFAEEL